MDAWGLDVVASGSQKGYMLPRTDFVAMSDRAWQPSDRTCQVLSGSGLSENGREGQQPSWL